MLHLRHIAPLCFFSLGLAAASPADSDASSMMKNTDSPVYSNVQFQPLLRAKQNPEDFVKPEEAAELFKIREELIQDLLKERQKILATDSEARKLHAEILKLNKKLATVMESKHAVRKIAREMTIIDSKIDNLELKKTPAQTKKNVLTDSSVQQNNVNK